MIYLKASFLRWFNAIYALIVTIVLHYTLGSLIVRSAFFFIILLIALELIDIRLELEKMNKDLKNRRSIF